MEEIVQKICNGRLRLLVPGSEHSVPDGESFDSQPPNTLRFIPVVFCLLYQPMALESRGNLKSYSVVRGASVLRIPRV